MSITNAAPKTRNEAIEWSKRNSISRMSRSSARAAGVLPLWTAFMAAKFDDDEVVDTDRGAWAKALSAVFPADRPKIIAATDCQKCGGTGFIRAFSHIRNGRCFACA